MDMLHEDYETISLSEILSLRDAYLNEEELWALCRECCLTLEYVRDSQDLFQGLCITPETVAFDHSGSVCFLDLDEEPEALYIAPEFDDVGNSFKSHLFSLGMTMLYGIEYNIQTEEPKHELSSQLSDLLTNLCADGDKQRPSIEHVIRQCDEILKEKSSQDICHCMINNFIRGSPLQDGSSSILDLSAGLTSYLNTQSPHSPRQSTPQDLYQQTDVTTNHKPENISHDTEQSNAKLLLNKNSKELEGNQTESDEYLLSRLLTSENKDSQTSEEQNNQDQFLISKLLDFSVPADTENCDDELAGLDISNVNYAVDADDENKANCDRSIVKENSDCCDNYKPSETVIENSDNIIKNSDRKYSNILFTGEMECLDLASILEITREKLDSLDLWSLISEGIIAIRKKKRHLPAFISPDTTVIKENGSIIFTGVPDGQKLETKYMAPELQQKGILSEKTCLYGLAMTLQTLSGNEDLDENLQDLLLSMLHSNCDKRPSINQALGICDNLQSMFDITSRQGCKILLQRAWNYYSDDDADYQNNNSLHESELQESSIESNNNDIETVPSSRHERKTAAPTPVSAFKPIHPENNPKPVTIGSTSSAFKPVAVKPQTISKPKPVYEGKVTQTHKVKQDEELTTGCNQGDVKQPEKAPKVMKKLKDLEKRLSRHRSVDESKFSDQETNEVNNNSDTSVDKNTNSDFNPGDSLSKLLQKFDGQLPDTDTLATAIAQYLQTQISGTSQKTPVACPSKDLDPESEFSRSASPSLPKPNQTSSAGVVDTSRESSTAIQTFTMPIHNITGQTSSYPIQLQLQQDPKTGFVQLIPVGVMSYGSVVPQIAVPMNTGQNCVSEIEDDTIPDKKTNIQHKNVVGKPPIQTRSIKQVVNKPTQPRSRTKSQGYMSDSGILEKSDNMEDGSFLQLTSNNARKQIRTLQNELELSFTGSHTSGTGLTKLNKTFLSDSGHFNQSNTGQRSFHQSGSRSANTSPSWSKDSGVSGLQPPYNTVGYNDKTLIERLLNTDGSQHQHILGEVLGVLRENHVMDDSDYDDFTVAEYITSLGNLRIDTFTGAVSEKYHQIEWSYTLLHTLYGIINHSHNRNKVLPTTNISNHSYSDHRRFSAPSYEQNQQFKSPPDSINTTNPEFSASHSAVKYSSPVQSNPTQLQRSHPLRSSLYRRTSGISETSDSTDSERKEKRRKFKKRYQLDRSKSSSLSNIVINSQNHSPEHRLKCESESFIRDTNRSLTVDVPSPTGNMYHGDSSPGSVSMNLESDYVQLSGSIHEYENINFIESRDPKQVPGRQYNRPVSDSYSIKSNQTQIIDQSNQSKIHRQDSFRQNKQFNRNLSKSQNLQVAEVPKSYSERYCSPDEMSNSSSNIKSASQDQSSNTSQYVPKIRKYDAKPNNNLTRRYVNKYSSDSESSRTDSLPLKARHDLGSQIPTGEKQASQKTLSTLLEKSYISLRRKIQVIYHWASVHADFSGDLEEFSSHIDEGDKAGIEHQLLSVQQQLGMEKKMRRKSQKFYQKLIDPVKTFKDDQKGVASQVLKDLEEMTRKVHFLQLCQTHLQMLLAEFNGIHLQYSYSLSLGIVNEILSLKPYPDNPLLQFQYMLDPHSNCQIQVLQAGETHALMAYLFITCAISNGFIHQFLYTYRYFISSESLLNFIIHRYTAASRSDPNDPRIQCIKQRTLDILYYWMEGFYNIDFELNKTLLFRLEQFLMTQLSHNDDKQESISELLRLCSHGYKIKFNSSNDDKDEEETTLYLKLESPKKVRETIKEWNSFKSLTRRSPTKRVQSFKDLTSITKACNNNDIDDGFYPRITKRNDAFTLLDYTPQVLVEQLTLITQEIFQQSHPIQYLNSKANGICVALSLPGLCTPSMIRRRASGGESKNLFLGQWMPSKILDELISLSQNISQWVSGELVSCSNPKTQAQLLTKFINVAQISEEIRNYSLCVSIIDGLENVIVRQLPTWRNISSKYITTMESLSKMKLKLKSEPFYLIQDSNYTLYPTIPYTLYFLLHVQQIEMGSFTLANGFIKWTKMRTICQLIDQIRIFRSNEYGFEPNFDIQDNLLQRMEEFLHLDIQAIASQNDTNFRRMSTGGLQSVLRKMKDKLGKP